MQSVGKSCYFMYQILSKSVDV